MKVYQRGKRWYVDFSYNGKRYRKSAGRTKREALLKLGEIQRRIEQEERHGIPANAPRSFTEYAEEYLTYARVEKAGSTYIRDTCRTGHLIRAFGDKKLSDITVRDIELYKAARSEAVKHVTVTRELNLLSHMFHRAIDLEYYRKENPVGKVKKYKEPPGRVRYLSLEERIRLLEECKRSQNPLLYAMVFTALETGMRKGEEQRLKWEDVNIERQSIRLRQTKNNEDRDIPISDRLLPLLQRLYIERCSPYVFSKPDGRPYGDWRRSFETACRHAEIDNFHWHDLRHDYASQLVMAGVDIYRVQKLMGHKTLSMTARYAHLSQAHLLEAVNRLGTHMAQLEELSVEESSKSRK